MSLTVKELLAKFTGDTSSLEASSQKATGLVNGFASKAMTAAAAAGAAFAALAVKQSMVGDQMGKMAQKYGIGTESFFRLAHAANLADLSAEELGNSFRFMENNIIAAIQGSDAQAAAFELLHLKAEELVKLKPEDAFARISQELMKIENPALRTATAIDIFGRAGANLMPLFKEGASGLAAAADEADRFGLTLSALETSKLDAVNDAIGKIKDVADGAARQFAVGFAPAIAKVTEELLAGVESMDEFKEAGEVAGEALAFVVNQVAGFANVIHATVNTVLAATWMAVKAFVEPVQFLLNKVMDGLEKIGGSKRERITWTTDIDSIINDQLSKSAGNIEDAGERFKSGFENFTSMFESSVRKTKAATDELTEGQAKLADVVIPKTAAQLKAMQAAADKAAEAAKKAREEQIQANNDLADSFISMKDNLLQGGDLWDGLKRSALSAINDIANNMIRLSFGGTVQSGGGGGIFGSIAKSIMSGMFSGGGGGSTFFGGGTGWVDWNAQGDVINGRTIFPSADGMQGMGEAGTEGILPLKRVGGKLGVHASGGGGGTTVINISAGVSQTVRAEMMRLLPSIRSEAIRATQEASMRGTSS